MKKVFLFIFVLLIATSLVLAVQGDAQQNEQQGNGNGSADQSGQGNGTQTNTETQNQGEETQLQNQVRVQSGNYAGPNGEQMQIRTENGLRLKVGDSEAKCSLELMQEQDMIQNRTKLMTQLSNGKNAEIKVMPNTASEKAIERLRLKICSSENNCSIELKEVGNKEQVKAAYEIQAQKEARVLALFKTRMKVQAQVDAETGEVIQSKKPWWAFLASE